MLLQALVDLERTLVIFKLQIVFYFSELSLQKHQPHTLHELLIHQLSFFLEEVGECLVNEIETSEARLTRLYLYYLFLGHQSLDYLPSTSLTYLLEIDDFLDRRPCLVDHFS